MELFDEREVEGVHGRTREDDHCRVLSAFDSNQRHTSTARLTRAFEFFLHSIYRNPGGREVTDGRPGRYGQLGSEAR
jgi:hypothetical protein